MEDSRSSMKDDQIGYVGDDSIFGNTHPQDGWSEEEFNIVYDDDFHNGLNNHEETNMFLDTKVINDSGMEYDYFGESDLEMGNYDDCEDAPNFDMSIDTSEQAPCNQTESSNKYSNDTGYPDDKRELYCKIMEMIFNSEAAAYSFYNRYAKDHGFSIRKHQVRRFDDELVRLRPLCVASKVNVTRNY